MLGRFVLSESVSVPFQLRHLLLLFGRSSDQLQKNDESSVATTPDSEMALDSGRVGGYARAPSRVTGVTTY